MSMLGMIGILIYALGGRLNKPPRRLGKDISFAKEDREAKNDMVMLSCQIATCVLTLTA